MYLEFHERDDVEFRSKKVGTCEGSWSSSADWSIFHSPLPFFKFGMVEMVIYLYQSSCAG